MFEISSVMDVSAFSNWFMKNCPKKINCAKKLLKTFQIIPFEVPVLP